MPRGWPLSLLRAIASVAAVVAAVAALLYWGLPSDTEMIYAGHRAPTVEDQVRRTTFERIYAERLWGADDAGKGTSGPGSTLDATKLYRAFLQDFLATYHIRSVVDAGCGTWEFSQAIDWSGIDYTGLDIVASVIEADQRRFGAPNIHFAVADIVRDDLPPADLLIVKDVLQHLSNADIHRFLAQLPRYRHVLLVNGVEADSLTAEPSELPETLYRPIDPTRPPHSVAGTKVFAWRYGKFTNLVVHVQPRAAGNK